MNYCPVCGYNVEWEETIDDSDGYGIYKYNHYKCAECDTLFVETEYYKLASVTYEMELKEAEHGD